MATKIGYAARTWLNRYVRKGGKVTTYFCPGCRTQRRTIRPTRRLVGSRGFTTSALTCTRCGEIHHVSTWPSGKTQVRELPAMEVATVRVADLQLAGK